MQAMAHQGGQRGVDHSVMKTTTTRCHLCHSHRRRRQSKSRAARTVRPTPSNQQEESNDEQSEQEARTYQVQRLPRMTNTKIMFTYYRQTRNQKNLVLHPRRTGLGKRLPCNPTFPHMKKMRR